MNERWRAVIEKSGFSQRVVAEQMGVSWQHLWKVLAGKHIPNAENAVALAQLLNLDAREVWQWSADAMLERATHAAKEAEVNLNARQKRELRERAKHTSMACLQGRHEDCRGKAVVLSGIGRWVFCACDCGHPGREG